MFKEQGSFTYMWKKKERKGQIKKGHQKGILQNEKLDLHKMCAIKYVKMQI